MAGVQLYDGLIKATEQIVAKFGKDVLTEERFVNILHDLCPDRDNPSIFKIVKSLVNDGVSSELLITKKKKFEVFLAKSSVSLAKNYGYDKQLVESIIYSLAVGCEIVQQPQSKTPKPTKHKRIKRIISKQFSINSPSISWSGLYNPFYLAVAYFGLFISPVVYLLAIIGAFWPSLTLFLILIIQTILFSVSYNKLIKHKPLPVIGGAFSAIILCAVVFFAFAPFYADSDSTKEVVYFLGISHHHDMLFPMITLVMSIYYLGFVNIGGRIAGYDLTLIIDNLDNHNPFNNTKINELLFNRQFMKGFIFSGLFIWLVGVFIMYLPTIDSWRIEMKNSLLRIERADKIMPLSFAEFKLCSAIDSCDVVIRTCPDYSYNNIFKGKVLKIDNESSIQIDSIIQIKTDWYTDSVEINLYSLEGKLVAIDVLPEYYVRDSIINLYSNKYGNPEYERVVKFEGVAVPNNYKECWLWTYKNGVIQFSDGRIRYYARYLETIADINKKQKEREELEKEKQKKFKEMIENERQRKIDSIKRVKQLEKERRKEVERKKALEQI